MARPLIGISTTYILDWSIIAKMAKKIRKSVPHAEIILGGAFINNQFLHQGAMSL